MSVAARERVLGLIAAGEREGATLVLDGRNVQVPGYPQGNFIGRPSSLM